MLRLFQNNQSVVPDLTMISKGQTGLYRDKGFIHKVRISEFTDNSDFIWLSLEPAGELQATENDDDEWEYHTASNLKQPFDFGGEKAGISLNKGILSVPFCGSLNLNEFAVLHFDRHEPDFHLLWYNIAPDSD